MMLYNNICRALPYQVATQLIRLPHSTMPRPFVRTYANTANDNAHTASLFVALSDLEEKFGIKFDDFPSVVTIGQQSSGKSSVLEAICGHTILPKAMKLATKKPLHLTTIRSKEVKFKVGERSLTNEKDAAEEIDRVNNNDYVKIINVTVWSPHVYNSSLIDLPGLFVVAGKNEAGMPKRVKELSSLYLQNPNTIPLVIHAGPSDPATNTAIKMIEKHSRESDTLGIITKIDMLEKQSTGFIQELLNGKTYPMGHGYCAVILRNDKDIEVGMTVNDKMKLERELFARMSLKPSGVDQMRRMISDIQLERVKEQIPKLLNDIDAQINNLRVSQDFLFNLLNNNQTKLASKLLIMIEKLVSSSIDRAEFEDKLKKELKEVVGSYVMPDTERVEDQYTKSRIDSNIITYNIEHRFNPSSYKEDGIKELFSYGLLSPIVLDKTLLEETFEREVGLALSLPMIELYHDDPLGRKRSRWNKYLNSYFTRLLADDNIHKLIYEVTERLILEYIYDDPEEVDELTKKFAEYMLKAIGNEAYEEKIKYSISAMINIEKRPQVSIFEIVRYVTQMHPLYFTFRGSMFESYSRVNKKIRLEIYSQEWNSSYLQVVSDKLTDNCYRNVAVNLLDRMVQKLLEMTLDMFNKNNTLKEQNKVKEKTAKLVEIRGIVASFNNKEEGRNSALE